GAFAADDYVVGAVVTGQIDPEDAPGLAYQWYYDAVTVDAEGAETHEYTPINGAGEMTYTIQEADVGKYLAFKAYMDEREVGVIDSLGPVLKEAPPAVVAPADQTACSRGDACPISQFSDASPDAWYHDGVHWALSSGAMNGVSGDRFDPAGTATRAMVVTMLWRLEGEPEGKAPAFTDTAAGSWYGQAVGWAAENGVVTGTSETTFAPDASVTREQLVTILYRYAQFKDQDVSVGEDTNILSYDDAFSISSWAMPAMQWACGSGIVSGVSETALGPGNEASRAQIATMFQRFCEPRTEPGSGDTVSHVFDFDGSQVRVTVDVSDGWEAEFGEMATYLYDGPNDDSREAAAYGVYDSQEDYDAVLVDAKAAADFAETDDGFTYTDSADVAHHITSLGNGVYFRVMVEPGHDAQAVFDRFSAELLTAAPAEKEA
ncbi:MAG: S-layer homology domain-containing protein, partial [Oscillospiraceae bacterium]|nr:S-layer homology domain-containing protein [Oscillospiraceae bacterium]